MSATGFLEQNHCSCLAVPPSGVVLSRGSESEFSVFSHPLEKRKTRILFVEDDDDIRSMTHTFLEAEGYQVWACSDGLKALHVHARIAPVDLLVSDVEMPFVLGTELAVAFSQRQPALNVLLTSGTALTMRGERLVSENGWQFLRKPFPVQVLLEAIDQVVARGRKFQRTKYSYSA